MINVTLAVLACFLWSTGFVGIKIGLKYAQPLYFAGIRFMLSGLLLSPFWIIKPSCWKTFKDRFLTILLISFFQTFLLYGLLFSGMTLVSGALAAIIFGASPLISAIAAHFMMSDDKMTPLRSATLGIGIFGVILISVTRNPWSPAGLKEMIGVMILIASSLASTIGNILVAKDQHNINPLMLNSIQLFIGGGLLFLVSFFKEGYPPIIDVIDFYYALLWLAMTSAVTFSLWFHLLKQPGVKVSEINSWKFIIPVSGAILSWTLIPEESPEMIPVIGMCCIAFSIFSYNYLSQKKKAYVHDAIDCPASRKINISPMK